MLLVGATGMLGRPVARALAGDDALSLRALVRDPARARTVLPASVEIVRGDLRDASALDDAMRDVDAVYMSLNTPFNPREAFDPDRDGARLIVEASRRNGSPWLLRLSALEAGNERSKWWAIARKREADAAVMAHTGAWTIFRPAWFMESLALFRVGPCATCFRAPGDTPLHWISGADYGAQVRAALMNGLGQGSVIPVQGPDAATMRDAIVRFARACSPRLRVVQTPYAALRAASLVHPRARYLRELLAETFAYATEFRASQTWETLGRPTMTIEDYARSIAQTGDWPRK